jgi:hypothetical protein
MLCDLDRINNLLIPPLAHCEKGRAKFAYPVLKILNTDLKICLQKQGKLEGPLRHKPTNYRSNRIATTGDEIGIKDDNNCKQRVL